MVTQAPGGAGQNPAYRPTHHRTHREYSPENDDQYNVAPGFESPDVAKNH